MNDLLNLPVEERLELLETLWDSIAAEQGNPGLDADSALDA